MAAARQRFRRRPPGRLASRLTLMIALGVVGASPPLPLDHKIFFLGPAKTCTTALHRYYVSRGHKACHNVCEGEAPPGRPYKGREAWWSATARHNLNAPDLRYFQVFSDLGDRADFRWLAHAYPHARFVLNSRGLLPWLVSKADHVARNRRQKNCTGPVGGSDSCPALTWRQGDNRDATMAGWTVREARHQAAVLSFFDGSAALRARFAVVDVEGMRPGDLAALLDWVARPDLGARVPVGPVLNATALPAGPSSLTGLVRWLLGGGVPSSRDFGVAKVNAHGQHHAATQARLAAALEALGCPRDAQWDRLYTNCAAGLERAGLPPLPEDPPPRASKDKERPRGGWRASRLKGGAQEMAHPG